MSNATIESGPVTPRRIEELGRIILAYSEVTEKLQQSHHRLEEQVQALRNELAEKNRLLERRNRLAALGEMAAGLAHEIRNPLGGIQLYASLLARDLADQPESLSRIEQIRAGTRRVEALMGQVLQFTREIRASIDHVDLASIVDETLNLAAAAIADKQIATRILGPQALPIRADALLISQAILNLSLNAIEAMKPGGTLTITYCGAIDETAGRQMRICVEDTGPGIAPQIMDRIFNPFFTTRDTGTGLGLAIVHRIVEAHDGIITASNREEGGARFEIRI